MSRFRKIVLATFIVALIGLNLFQACVLSGLVDRLGFMTYVANAAAAHAALCRLKLERFGDRT